MPLRSGSKLIVRFGIVCAAALVAMSSCKTPTDAPRSSTLNDAAGKDDRATVAAAEQEAGEYLGTRYGDVWNAVKSDPYKVQKFAVTLASFGQFAATKFRQAAKRTVSDKNDLLPRFTKLIRPNGICMTGVWRMTEDSPYTGYFRKGKEALIIARASVGLSETTRASFRSFGMGGKLYPTADAADQAAHKTANFFVIDDNAGTKKGAFVDPEPPMTNKPPYNPDANVLSVIDAGILAVIKVGQELADNEADERQLYPISELGEEPGAAIKTPRLIRIHGLSRPKIAMSDFRDELRMSNYDGPIQLAVDVAETRTSAFTRIGEITFTETVVSDTCDHGLHFYHARWRNDP